MDIINILSYFNTREIPLTFLNIANTNVKNGIINKLNFLLNDEKFKCLDISGTPCVETSEDFSKNPKIIFIENFLFDRKELKETFEKKL